MKRESINPWDWGLAFNMDQGELVSGIEEYLHCSGQVALKPDAEAELGVSVVAPGDLRGQMEYALANVDSVLERAGMGRKHILTLRFFTTDIDEFLESYDVYTDWIADAGIRPPQSLLGVHRLVFPELMVEIEATAGR